MTKNTILFDLGGTLAQYYDRSEFPSILDQGIEEVQLYLDKKGLLGVTPETVASRVREEDHESQDHHSRPLEERLTRIFGLEAPTGELLMGMCERFMVPIFARGRCYDDTIPTLKELRSRGLRIAIVSNTSWGSPAVLWRAEIRRLGLDSYMDSIVLDRDVGWRKPSKRIFEFAMKNLDILPGDCLFVGDEPRWDLAGPRAVGIEAVLIDRMGIMAGVEQQPIRSLYELTLRL
jgi:putative hydrolase of the HAD superfamily